MLNQSLRIKNCGLAPVTQLVEYLVYTQAVIGSSPVGRTLNCKKFGKINMQAPIAQLVLEQRTFNPWVLGSNPSGGTERAVLCLPKFSAARSPIVDILLWQTQKRRTSMTVGVYGIFDKRDDTCLYVGQSKNIELRWRKHLNGLRANRHSRKKFSRWLHDHGEDNLDFRVLETCENTPKIKNELEQKWFDDLSPLFHGKSPSSRGVYGSGERRGVGVTTSQLLLKVTSKNEAESDYEKCDFSATALAEYWNCSVNSVYILLRKLEIELWIDRKKFKSDPVSCVICKSIFTPAHSRIKTCSRSCGGRLAHPRQEKEKEDPYSYIDLPQSQKAGKVASHNR